MKVREEYDLTQQAEAVFLDYLPRWRESMSSLVGQAVLEMAVSAARSNKPLPWKRLQNFGISPTSVAPENLLPLHEINQLAELHLETLAELVNLAMSKHSATLYGFVLSEVSLFASLLEKDLTKNLEKNLTMLSDFSSALKSSVEDVNWFSQPLRQDFTYANAFSGLQRRWNSRPTVMVADCTRVRQRLAAALV